MQLLMENILLKCPRSMRRPLEMAIMGAFCGGGGHEGRANSEAIRALLLVKRVAEEMKQP